MKTNLLLIIPVFMFVSCNDRTQNDKDKDTITDSSTANKDKSNNGTAMGVTGFDTTGQYDAPIKIVSCSVREKNIDTFDSKEDNLNHEGHYKRFVYINVNYKNVSTKKVTGVKFMWYVVDKNDSPSDLHCEDCNEGVGMGATGSVSKYPHNRDVKIGQTITDEWMQPSKSGVKLKLLAPVLVEFYDDTKWNIGKLSLTKYEEKN